MKRSKPPVFWTKEKADLPTFNNQSGEAREKNNWPKTGRNCEKTYFLNQQCLKKDKMYLSLHLRFMRFPKFQTCLKLMHIKKINTTANLRCHKL